MLFVTVPYGNRLIDSAASMMDPMRNKVVVATPGTQRGSVTSTSSIQSVVIRKPLDVGKNISVIESRAVNAAEQGLRVPGIF